MPPASPGWNSPILHYSVQTAFFLAAGCMCLSIPAENWKTLGPTMRRILIVGIVGAFVGTLISAGRLVYVLFFATS